MGDGDVISRLPGDLLISILSRLTLKEAMATSVLSRRWEKLWTLYHGNLDFELSMALRRKGCTNYANVVNKVLDTLELVEGGGVFDSFTIRFNLCPNNSSSVDKWVQFALEKRMVKRLDFDFGLYFVGCLHHITIYEFPPIQSFYAQQQNIEALTSINFSYVNVSGEVIEHFLSNCPLLQNLKVREPRKALNHLRVSGETLALRHLVLWCCPYLTTVEISAPNLLSLFYLSSGTTKAKFDVRSAPKLVDISIGVLETPASTALAIHLLTCFSYIQKLELFIRTKEPEDSIKLIKLTSLKHLTVIVSGSYCGHILAWTPLLVAFPVLQKFTLDMKYRSEDRILGVKRDDDKFPSQCLKEFEFVGFGRSAYDIRLVRYFIKHMVPLEEIILRCDGGAPTWLSRYNESVEKAKSIAVRLKRCLPKKVNLVVS